MEKESRDRSTNQTNARITRITDEAHAGEIRREPWIGAQRIPAWIDLQMLHLEVVAPVRRPAS